MWRNNATPACPDFKEISRSLISHPSYTSYPSYSSLPPKILFPLRTLRTLRFPSRPLRKPSSLPFNIHYPPSSLLIQ